MTVQITIRNLSADVRNELAARAARRGLSMQESLRQELERLANRPDLLDTDLLPLAAIWRQSSVAVAKKPMAVQSDRRVN
jgi:hypothetical protein